MVVPYRHVAGLDELDLDESAELVAVTQQAVRALRDGRGPARVQRRDQPRARRGRLAGRPPAPARRPALGRRRQLHHRRRPDEGDPAAARRDTVRPGRGVALAMINQWARAAIKGVVEPTAAWLVRRGVHPDAVTVSGTVASTASALWLIPTGHLVAASRRRRPCFALLDVLDGAMARARGVTSPFGGVLDSVGDRLVDGAVFAGDHVVGVHPGPAAARGPRAGLPHHRPADLLHQGPRRGRGPPGRRRPGRTCRAPDPRARRCRAHRDRRAVRARRRAVAAHDRLGDHRRPAHRGGVAQRARAVRRGDGRHRPAASRERRSTPERPTITRRRAPGNSGGPRDRDRDGTAVRRHPRAARRRAGLRGGVGPGARGARAGGAVGVRHGRRPGRAPRAGPGSRRLRSNLARVRPDAGPDELDALTAAGVRSYARYWREAFRLPRDGPRGAGPQAGACTARSTSTPRSRPGAGRSSR